MTHTNHSHPTHHAVQHHPSHPQHHTHPIHPHHKKVKKSHIIGVLSLGAILCAVAIAYFLYSNPTIFKTDVISDQEITKITTSPNGVKYDATNLIPEGQHEAYISSLARSKDSIMSALVSNSEVNCLVNDIDFGTTTVDFLISMKDGSIRIDLSDIKDPGSVPESSLIAKNEGYWFWSSSVESLSGYTAFTDPAEKLNLIMVALDPFASDPQVYADSCMKGSVAESRFDLPSGIAF